MKTSIMYTFVRIQTTQSPRVAYKVKESAVNYTSGQTVRFVTIMIYSHLRNIIDDRCEFVSHRVIPSCNFCLAWCGGERAILSSKNYIC